jgi:hypothetical protein
MNRTLVLTWMLLAACGRQPRPATHDRFVAASQRLTDAYAASRMAKWSFHAHAAGSDCDVLVLETPMILADSVVDAIHYGAGGHAVPPGGVYGFARERGFRGTAYTDRSRKFWTFGDVTPAEAAALEPCR